MLESEMRLAVLNDTSHQSGARYGKLIVSYTRNVNFMATILYNANQNNKLKGIFIYKAILNF